MNNTPITAQQVALAMITYGDAAEVSAGEKVQNFDSRDAQAFRAEWPALWQRFEALAAADQQEARMDLEQRTAKVEGGESK